MEGPQRPPDMFPVDTQDKIARLRKRREHALWYAVVGTGLMFVGGIFWQIAVGGAMMALYGAAVYIWASVKITRMDDPWKDPELDAWEEEHF